jgi:hypothetical protein
MRWHRQCSQATQSRQTPQGDEDRRTVVQTAKLEMNLLPTCNQQELLQISTLILEDMLAIPTWASGILQCHKAATLLGWEATITHTLQGSKIFHRLAMEDYNRRIRMQIHRRNCKMIHNLIDNLILEYAQLLHEKRGVQITQGKIAKGRERNSQQATRGCNVLGVDFRSKDAT